MESVGTALVLEGVHVTRLGDGGVLWSLPVLLLEKISKLLSLPYIPGIFHSAASVLHLCWAICCVVL